MLLHELLGLVFEFGLDLVLNGFREGRKRHQRRRSRRSRSPARAALRGVVSRNHCIATAIEPGKARAAVNERSNAKFSQ